MRAWLALAWLLLPGLAAAAPTPPAQSWPIDPAQSQVQFGVRKFWFAHGRGTFPALSGTLRRIDTQLGADLGEVDADIDVAALRMDDANDRARALGADFFDAAQFSTIRFDSDPFPLAELVSGGVLRGMLALHGERRPVTLTLQPSNCPRQPLECVIRARGAISRSAFGMHGWRGVLSDKVTLDLRIRLKLGD
ncbi:MAG: YceI family protein [Rhodanobacteraceae bacterium]